MRLFDLPGKRIKGTNSACREYHLHRRLFLCAPPRHGVYSHGRCKVVPSFQRWMRIHEHGQMGICHPHPSNQGKLLCLASRSSMRNPLPAGMLLCNWHETVGQGFLANSVDGTCGSGAEDVRSTDVGHATCSLATRTNDRAQKVDEFVWRRRPAQVCRQESDRASFRCV